jgi:membrane-associated phospholipid phosphatase
MQKKFKTTPHTHAVKKYDPIFIAVCIASFVVFVVTTFMMQSGSIFLFYIDQNTNAYVASQITSPLLHFAQKISDWGNTNTLYTIGIVVALVYLLHCKWRRSAVLFVSVVVSLRAVLWFKDFYMRERPFNAVQQIGNASYPSGHAGVAAAFFVACIYVFAPNIESKILRRIFIGFCLVATLAIGLSRIALSVHWVSDVVGGWALGAFVASGIIVIVQKLFKKEAL